MATAIPSDAIEVQHYKARDAGLVTLGDWEELRVHLYGEHHDMYQQYRKLPAIVEFQGCLWRKTGWNSDFSKAYYTRAKRGSVAWPV